MLVVIGVIPAFLVAALIEGFVTGRTGPPILEIASARPSRQPTLCSCSALVCRGSEPPQRLDAQVLVGHPPGELVRMEVEGRHAHASQEGRRAVAPPRKPDAAAFS